MSGVRKHFWQEVSRWWGGCSRPWKYGLSGCMPAVVSRTEGSWSGGTSDPDGMRRWSRSAKKPRNSSRISSERMASEGTLRPIFAAIVDIPPNVGYPVVFILIALETMGIPLPGETALIAASLLAHDGKLSIEVVVLLAAAAAILGDNVGFMIGRKFGRRIFEKPGIAYDKRQRLLAIGEPF